MLTYKLNFVKLLKHQFNVIVMFFLDFTVD